MEGEEEEEDEENDEDEDDLEEADDDIDEECDSGGGGTDQDEISSTRADTTSDNSGDKMTAADCVNEQQHPQKRGQENYIDKNQLQNERLMKIKNKKNVEFEHNLTNMLIHLYNGK